MTNVKTPLPGDEEAPKGLENLRQAGNGRIKSVREGTYRAAND
ncbi:hypothetical protein [Archangium minus]